jgi:hypothetical protein
MSRIYDNIKDYFIKISLFLFNISKKRCKIFKNKRGIRNINY